MSIYGFKNDEQRRKWNEYNSKYSKRHYKTVTIKVHLENEADIVAYLEKYGNGRIKELIKADIKSGK